MSSQGKRGRDHGARELVPEFAAGAERDGGDLTGQLRPLVARSLAELGYLLDDFGVRKAGRRLLVKVVVDAEDHIGLDEIARASKALGAALDQADHLLAGAYTLEVTSPGVERPLTLPRHWRRAHTRLVNLHQSDGTVTTARVGRADEHGVQLLIGGTLRRLDYASIERAVVEIEFRAPSDAELALLDPQQPGGEPAGTDSRHKDHETQATKEDPR